MADDSKALILPEHNDVISKLPIPMQQEINLIALMVKDNNSGIKTLGQGITIYQKCKELGLPWANAVPHITVIGDKSGLDVHLIKAILSRPISGITWKYIENYKPVYDYLDKNSVVYAENELPPNHVIVASFNKVKEDEDRIPFIICPTVVDKKPKYLPATYRTTVEFTRIKKNIRGEWIEIKETSSFSLRDAYNAGLHLKKDGTVALESPWIKYPRIQTDHRAFTFGARAIASDLLFGALSTPELADITKTHYVPNEDGTCVIIEDNT